MEIIIFLLILSLIYLFYKVRVLTSFMVVSNFSNAILNRILIDKNTVSKKDIDIEINKAIGDMQVDEGNKIIKYAKRIGVVIPNYMDEKELEIYLNKQAVNRAAFGDFKDFI